MQQIRITLKNEKQRLYIRFSLFMIIILTLLYVYLGFFVSNNTNDWLKIMVPVFLALLVVAHVVIKKTENKPGAEVFFFFLFLGWTGLKLFWLAGVTIILLLLFRIALNKKTVLFSESHIFYPSFPKKKISWDTLNNCLLKDGLLTIDFKNNKLIQQLIDDKSGAVDENIFNEFCNKQINKSR